MLQLTPQMRILVAVERPEPVVPDHRPVRGPLHGITPLEFVQVRRTPEEPLFNSLRGIVAHWNGYDLPHAGGSGWPEIASQLSVGARRCWRNLAPRKRPRTFLEQPETPAPENDSEPPSEKTPGHGRNGSSSYTGAQRVSVPHPTLQGGEVFTAQEPEGVGLEKYDETTAAMHARAASGARAVGRTHRRVHLRRRLDQTRTTNHAVLHRTPTRGRKLSAEGASDAGENCGASAAAGRRV